MRALLHGLGPLLPGVEHRAHAAVGICWKNCWQDASPHGHPHTQRQRLDLDSGREDLDQSCLGLKQKQRHKQGLRWPDRGSPREAEVEMRVLERFGGQVELMRAARLASSAHDWQGQPETNPQRGHGGKEVTGVFPPGGTEAWASTPLGTGQCWERAGAARPFFRGDRKL